MLCGLHQLLSGSRAGGAGRLLLTWLFADVWDSPPAGPARHASAAETPQHLQAWQEQRVWWQGGVHTYGATNVLSWHVVAAWQHADLAQL